MRFGCSSRLRNDTKIMNCTKSHVKLRNHKRTPVHDAGYKDANMQSRQKSRNSHSSISAFESSNLRIGPSVSKM
jgi:hypothetical protein